MKRLAIVIGAMKAGTTSLVRHLGAHPDVAAASPKEPGYFAFDEVYARGPAWYASLFPIEDREGALALEGSTDYSKFPHARAADRIRAFDGDIRLIYVMRHPLRRMESHAQHTQRARRELGTRDTERLDHSLDGGVSPLSLDATRYAAQIDQYRDFYDDGRLLLTTLERLTCDERNEIRRICDFLNLDPERLPMSMQHANPKPVMRYKTRKMPFFWRAAVAIAPLRAAVKAALPEGARMRLRQEARGREAIKGRFKFTEAEEVALLRELAPDLRRLRDEYGVDPETEWGLQVDEATTPKEGGRSKGGATRRTRGSPQAADGGAARPGSRILTGGKA